MRKKKKGIKVCRRNPGGIFLSAFEDGKVVKYKIDKWAKRPKGCGPLAVFDNIDSARSFLIGQWNDDRTFFHCEFKESKESLLYKHYSDGEVHRKTIGIPEGTMFADKVKILKEFET